MRTLFLLAAGLLMAGGAVAAEPVSGSAGLLASNCFNCHGTDGRTSAAIPPLAGVEKDYVVEALKQYRDGSREATIMHQLAKGYTDEEFAALAAYFSKLKP